jgi:hypothetical protein
MRLHWPVTVLSLAVGFLAAAGTAAPEKRVGIEWVKPQFERSAMEVPKFDRALFTEPTILAPAFRKPVLVSLRRENASWSKPAFDEPHLESWFHHAEGRKGLVAFPNPIQQRRLRYSAIETRETYYRVGGPIPSHNTLFDRYYSYYRHRTLKQPDPERDH